MLACRSKSPSISIPPITGIASLLRRANWRLVDPHVVATPAGFAKFVRASGAEFSVAQGVYVDTASGWFSDRTVRYLASGRPAVVQDTGLRDTLARRGGAADVPDARGGRRQARVRWSTTTNATARAARRLAEEYFASDRALAPLLEAAGVAP